MSLTLWNYINDDYSSFYKGWLEFVKSNSFYLSEDKDYKIELEVPRFNKKQLTVELENNLLVVKGDNGSSKFTQSFLLEQDADVNKLTSKLENGVLYISIPKKQKDKKTFEIE